MTERPWLATYRECDIDAEINPDAYPSVVHMLERAMTVHAEKPAFRSFGQTLTYAEVDRQSRNFASYLQTKLGVKKGRPNCGHDAQPARISHRLPWHHPGWRRAG